MRCGTAAGAGFNFTSPVVGATAAAVDGNTAGLVTGLGGTVITLEARSPLRVHSKAWGPSCSVREVWSLDASVTKNLVLARLGHAAALMALLDATMRRPRAEEMRVLASTCLSRPQFRATLPAGGHSLAATLRSYGAC